MDKAIHRLRRQTDESNVLILLLDVLVVVKLLRLRVATINN